MSSIVDLSGIPEVTELGQGFISVLRSATNTVITGRASEGSWDSDINQKVCTSEKDVHDAFSIGGKVKASYGIFSASASINSVSETTKHSFGVSVVVTAIRHRTRTLTQPKLVEGYGDLSNLHSLYTSGGDCWVSSVTEGSKYVATFNYSCDSQENKEKLTTKLKASVTEGVGMASAEISTAHTSIAKETNSTLTINVHIEGSTKAPKDHQENTLIDFANTFCKGDHGGSKILDFSVSNYQKVYAIDQSYEKLKTYSYRISGTEELHMDCKHFLDSYEDVLQRGPIVLKQMDHIIDIYQHYRKKNLLNNLYDRRNRLQNNLIQLGNLATLLVKNPQGDNGAWPDIDRGLLKTPKMNFEFVWGGGHGNDRGGEWFQDVHPSDVNLGITVDHIEIFGGEWADQLRTTYKYAHSDGFTSTKGKWNPSLTYFGPFEALLNDPVVKIKIDGKISAPGASIVSSLSFGMQSGKEHSIGPSGSWTGEWDTGPKDTNFLIGLAGRSADYVDWVQPIFLALWEPYW